MAVFLEPRDGVLYSDGILEAWNRNGEEYEFEKRFYDRLTTSRQLIELLFGK